MTSASDPWGRVDEDGTVYVRTAEGERPVGSWQAGDGEEALAFFRRRYQSLVTEVELLERRIERGYREHPEHRERSEHREHGTELSPSQAQTSIDRVKEQVATANAVGDLDALGRRLEALDETVERQRTENRAARARAREEARETKERIVAEAEQIGAEGTHWKTGGNRFRELVEEWKAAGRIDRSAESELWNRFSSARNQFSKRRKAYFAELEEERERSRVRKEALVTEAEGLADSTNWGPTASRFKELMRSWKAAGRAPRDTDEMLWQRFKSAQDNFFQARSAAFSERDAELRGNQERKEQLLAEAQQLLPVRNPRQARAKLRSLQQRWDQIGPVPRESRERLEGGLRRVADTVRSAQDKPNPEAQSRAEETVAQLKSSIEQLEKRLERARAQERDKAIREAEEALEARRSWLAEAERTLGDLSGQ